MLNKDSIQVGQSEEDQKQRVETGSPSVERLEGNIVAGSKRKCDFDDERESCGGKQDD